MRFDRRDLDESSDVPPDNESVADAMEESPAAAPVAADEGGVQEPEPEQTRDAGDAETDGDDEDFRPSKAKRARGSQRDKGKKPQATNGRRRQPSTAAAAAGGSTFFDDQGEPLPSTSGVSMAAVAASAAAVGAQQPSDDVDDGENEVRVFFCSFLPGNLIYSESKKKKTLDFRNSTFNSSVLSRNFLNIMNLTNEPSR